MDRFQILKGEKRPSAEEVKAKLDREKLQRFTDAYEAIKKPSTEQEPEGPWIHGPNCESCTGFNAGCSDAAYPGCKWGAGFWSLAR